MPPRGRPKRKHTSESGTSSIADSEDTESTSSRPRRSRLPRRYFDDDYSPPPSKKRAAQRDTPSDGGGYEEEEEEELKLEVTPTSQQHTPKEKTPATAASTTTKTPRTRGRPKKNPTPPRRKSTKPKEEDIIYMDEDSEDEEESSDDEFMIPDEQEMMEEEEEVELNLSDIIKAEKNLEEDKYCPWIDQDPETLPKLELPETSLDIPISRQSTMDAIEIYEILRSYHRTLRITPFTFEDFCAALISRNNSCIMAEVHMALLRVCWKSDDDEQTHYSVTETNNSVNIIIHHMDTLTYAEVLRQYIEAYPFADSSVREAINVENYPYVGYEAKLVVLLFMSYRFLYSSEFKRVVNNQGKFQNDENCRVCGKSSGRIVGCTQCEAAFHVECSHLKPFPDILICNICKRNNVRGVLPLDESIEKEPLRSQPIGRDRYGRYYWYLVRRLIVQSVDETEIHYYSTPPQLYQLLQKLDRDYYEKDLCEAIRLRIDEFLEQMTLTVEMTSERREAAMEIVMKKTMVGYEFADATTPQIYLHKDSMKRMASILRDCSSKVQIKKEEIKQEEPEEEGVGPLVKSPPEFEEDSILPESMLGIFNGCLINTFWSGGASQEELIEQFMDHQTSDSTQSWRMGDEGNDQTFMQYYNYYSRNEMAENFLTRKKQADKKKYMASKFATIENFEWVVAKDRQFYGNSVLHNKFVGWTLSKIARKIPGDLMHRKWPEIAKSFDLEVSVADDYKRLATCLLKLDAVARKTIFMPQWWNGLGQTKLERITVEQREQFVKEQQKIKKLEADALSKELDDSFIRVNYTKPKWPNTYILRQRGETYRNAGKGMMGGWAWVAAKYVEKWVPSPMAPVLPLAVTQQEKKMESSSNRKARRLELLVSKIVAKRDDLTQNGPKLSTFELVNKCYSPTCRRTFTTTTTTYNSKCYSSVCRSGFLMTAKQRNEEEEIAKKGVLGEDKPWPIPDIQTFSTRRGGKSLFVLQKNSRILRQMIQSGGCQQVYMPGFSSGIKSNLLIWPYPAPRPTLDLCWKWQTLNSRSLHAVALQLKVMWSSIKWNEFEPDDTHPDRRVVIDTPNHDERRRIIRHKEMPPYGQYERYELEIEIIPLYDEQEEEDESWLSRNRQTDCSQRTSSNRKKRPQRSLDNRQATAIRKEWVDGVTLKVFEIRDYWKYVRMEAEKAARRKMEAARKAVKAREEAERQRVLSLHKPPLIPRITSSIPPILERTNVPYMGATRRNISGDMNGNGRYLEKYNNSQVLPPRTPYTPLPSSASSSSIGRSIAPNPMIRKVPMSSLPHYTQQEIRQNQNLQQQYSHNQYRVAAGSDHHSGGNGTMRAVYMTQGSRGGIQYSSQPPQQHQQPPMRYMANGYHYPEGMMRGGGRQTPIGSHLPSTSRSPQRPMLMKPFGEPTNEMRRMLPVAEEAVAAHASDGDDQPPVIPRYEASNSDPQRQPPQQRPMYTGQQMVRTMPTGSLPPGAKGNVIYLKSTDGGTQKMLVRPAAAAQQEQSVYRSQDFPPGTVLSGGARVVAVRPGQGQSLQQVRQAYTGGGTPRYVRVQNTTGTPRPSEQIVRRVVQTGPPQRPMFQEYMDQDQGGAPPPPQQQQQMRYVLQGTSQQSTAPKMTRVLPRGGMTMQMGQQQQHHPAQYELDNQLMPEATGFAVSTEQQEQQ